MPSRIWTDVTGHRRALKSGEFWPELTGMTIASAKAWLLANDYGWILANQTAGSSEDDQVCSAFIQGFGVATCCGFPARGYPHTQVFLNAGGLVLGDLVVDDDEDTIWPGSLEGCSCGSEFCVYKLGASGGTSDYIACDPETGYALLLGICGNYHTYRVNFKYYDGPGSGSNLISSTVVTLGTVAGSSPASFTVPFSTPAGTQSFRVGFQSKLGGWHYRPRVYKGAECVA